MVDGTGVAGVRGHARSHRNSALLRAWAVTVGAGSPANQAAQRLLLTHVIAPSRFLASLNCRRPSIGRHRDYQEAPAMFRASTT
ncbi:hypothetical protein E5221_03010 [Pseudomonas sp. A2]|nr:hypothetical protein E5221_03010 [Pseudomonas sp. A2]